MTDIILPRYTYTGYKPYSGKLKDMQEVADMRKMNQVPKNENVKPSVKLGIIQWEQFSYILCVIKVCYCYLLYIVLNKEVSFRKRMKAITKKGRINL